jgi:hypothetical protein
MDKNPHPITVPVVFLRVGWMDRYEGIAGGDTISGGGSYIAEHGFGHEIFNYLPFRNKVYGFVQARGPKRNPADGKINLFRLGAEANDESVSGVLAVWVATAPSAGAFVVGWYRNATVYGTRQPPPAGSARRHADEDIGYYVTASRKDAVLLPPDERVFSIPQKGKGEFGQSNIWYADDPATHRQLRLDVLRYVDTRQLPTPPVPGGTAPRQPDPLLRQKVEQIAVEATVAHFKRLGYRVSSVERDNLGWDLNAVAGKRNLQLEVKGLSGSRLVVELTPNEYSAMNGHQDSYRICIVTNTLTAPSLNVFAYSPDSGQWMSPERQLLTVQELVAARCSAR